MILINFAGMEFLDVKIASAALKQSLKKKNNNLIQSGKRVPHLAAVLIGDDPASHTYVNSKVKNCKEIGIQSTLITHGSSITEGELLSIVKDLNNRGKVDGILV